MTQASAASARSFTQAALAWVAACCAVTLPLALALEGSGGAAAVILGAATMGLAVASLARLLGGLLHGQSARPRFRTLLGAALRWPLLAAGLAAAAWIRLPPGWLLVGVSAWPAALLIEGLRSRTSADAVMPQA